MSLFEQMQSAARQAQNTLAQMKGMSGSHNTLYGEEPLVLIYGQPRVVEDLNGTGGVTRRVEIPATMTREQRATCPATQSKLTRVDITPNVIYRIANADVESDELHYVLTLVKSGA